jgi:hypothetical protein
MAWSVLTCCVRVNASSSLLISGTVNFPRFSGDEIIWFQEGVLGL